MTLLVLFNQEEIVAPISALDVVTVEPLQVAGLPSTTVTSNGASAPFDIGFNHTLLRGSFVLSNVLGATGDTEITVALETSPDGANGWRTAIEFQFRSPRAEEFTVDELQRYCRFSWQFSGASGATFSCSPESHVLFATRRDLRKKSIPDAVTDGEDRDVIAEELLAASSDAADALRVQYPSMSLTSWPDSLKMRCCNIARYRIFARIGFQPQGVDELIVKDHNDAMVWLRAVAGRRVILSNVGVVQMNPPTRVTFSRDNPDPPRRFSDDWGDYH